MHNITTNLHIYTLKCAKSATFTLTPSLTPYTSTYYAMYNYTRAKNLPYTTEALHLQCPIKVVHEIQNYIPEHKRLNKDNTSINRMCNTSTAHGKDKSRILQWWYFGMQPTFTPYRIPHNNTRKRLQIQLIISLYIMYTRIAAKSKEFRFIYCTLCQFCA